MKKLSIALLCLLLAAFYACGQAPEADEAATSTKQAPAIGAGNTAPSAREDKAEPTTTTTRKTKTPTTTMQYSTVPKAKIIANKDDPYSYIIKEEYDSFYDYHKDSIDLSGNPYLNHFHYAFYDIDGNGTKALLLGMYKCIETIFVVQNGVAVLQDQYSWDSESGIPSVIFKNGIIRSGDDYAKYYRFIDGELKMLQPMLVRTGYVTEYFRREPSKDISITKEEYERLKREFEGNGEIVKIDWKPLAEYGK